MTVLSVRKPSYTSIWRTRSCGNDSMSVATTSHKSPQARRRANSELRPIRRQSIRFQPLLRGRTTPSLSAVTRGPPCTLPSREQVPRSHRRHGQRPHRQSPSHCETPPAVQGHFPIRRPCQCNATSRATSKPAQRGNPLDGSPDALACPNKSFATSSFCFTLNPECHEPP